MPEVVWFEMYQQDFFCFGHVNKKDSVKNKIFCFFPSFFLSLFIYL